MPVFLLAIGVALSLTISTLWNTGQIAIATGGRRAAHLVVIGASAAILGALGLDLPEPPVRFLAIALIAAATAIFLLDQRRNRLACLIQIGFGALVASGLPFALT